MSEAFDDVEELTDMGTDKTETIIKGMSREELVKLLLKSDRNELLDDKLFAIAQRISKYRKNVIPSLPQGDLNQTRREFFIRNI